jgi:hypothetical protein
MTTTGGSGFQPNIGGNFNVAGAPKFTFSAPAETAAQQAAVPQAGYQIQNFGAGSQVLAAYLASQINSPTSVALPTAADVKADQSAAWKKFGALIMNEFEGCGVSDEALHTLCSFM